MTTAVEPQSPQSQPKKGITPPDGAPEPINEEDSGLLQRCGEILLAEGRRVEGDLDGGASHGRADYPTSSLPNELASQREFGNPHAPRGIDHHLGVRVRRGRRPSDEGQHDKSQANDESNRARRWRQL